jgi:LuxR family maltose regulon positive regulatory protein
VTAQAQASTALLLESKLAVPEQRARPVTRARLHTLLDRAVQGPLTLVSAAAGSGKTTLLSGWVTGRDSSLPRVSWLSLDKSDARPPAFWTGFVESLRRSGVEVERAGLPVQLMAPDLDMLCGLAAALSSAPHPVVVVLDGCSVLADTVFEELDFLLQHSSARLRLVLLTREDPPLPLHRHRLEGTITELRQQDLAFTDSEVASLLSRSGVQMSARRVAMLTDRTEGWAAAIRFAAVSLAAGGDADEIASVPVGTATPVAEFLTAEVMDTQPADLRDALLRSSVVDVMDPGLFDELTGRNDGHRVLDLLVRRNAMLLPVPGLARSYRYHELLRDLLRHQLAYEQPELLPRLHQVAAGWLAEHGRVDEAVGHAAHAGAWSQAARHLVDGYAIGSLLSGDEAASLGAVFANLPNDVIDAPTCVVRAAIALTAYDDVLAANELHRAEELCDHDPPDQAVQLAVSVLGVVVAGRQSDVEKGLAAASTAEEILSGATQNNAQRAALTTLISTTKAELHVWAGDVEAARADCTAGITAADGVGQDATLVARCLGQAALIEALQGHLRRAADLSARAHEIVTGSGNGGSKVSIALETARAWVATERLELEDARHHNVARTQSGETGAATAMIVQLLTARLLRLDGDVDGCGRLLDELHASRVGSSLPAWLRARLAAEDVALINATQGRWSGPPQVTADLETLPDLEAWLVRRSTGIDESTRPHEGSHLTALNHVRAPVDTRVTGWLVEADRCVADGQPARARTAVNRALLLAGREGMRRPFSEAPVRVRDFLMEDPALAEARRWVDASAGGGPGQSPAAIGMRDASPPAAVFVALTDKEQEVLGHLADQRTNDEIAAVMVLSVNTIRTHVRSILRKLSVSRRQDAVRQARALNLIAS